MANQYNRFTDPLADSGSGSNSILNGAQTSIDFGATPVYDATFTVTDSLVTASTQIVLQQDGSAATGKDADENQMDQLLLIPTASDGSFTIYAKAYDGSYLAGAFNINYRRA